MPSLVFDSVGDIAAVLVLDVVLFALVVNDDDGEEEKGVLPEGRPSCEEVTGVNKCDEGSRCRAV